MIPAIERANKDRAEGRLWKARDRLLGARRNHGNSSELLDALGQVLWDMGDAPAAGAVWFLVDREDKIALAAREAFVERHGYKAHNMLVALSLRNPPEQFPSNVAERVQALIRAAETDGYIWKPPSPQAEPSEDREVPSDIPFLIGCCLSVSGFLIPFVIGVNAIIEYFF